MKEERINFLDDFGFDWDACWAVPYNIYGQWRWWNTTPLRHGKGNTFSFVDGHSKWWRWQDQRTIDLAEKLSESEEVDALSEPAQPDNSDLIKVASGVWGGVE